MRPRRLCLLLPKIIARTIKIAKGVSSLLGYLTNRRTMVEVNLGSGGVLKPAVQNRLEFKLQANA